MRPARRRISSKICESDMDLIGDSGCGQRISPEIQQNKPHNAPQRDHRKSVWSIWTAHASSSAPLHNRTMYSHHVLSTLYSQVCIQTAYLATADSLFKPMQADLASGTPSNLMRFMQINLPKKFEFKGYHLNNFFTFSHFLISKTNTYRRPALAGDVQALARETLRITG